MRPPTAVPIRPVGCLVALCLFAVSASFAFGSRDALTSNGSLVAALFALGGLGLLVGLAAWSRPVFLLGLSGAMLAFAQRAWEIGVGLDGVSSWGRVRGVGVYAALFVLTVGLGFSFMRADSETRLVSPPDGRSSDGGR